MFLWSQLRQQLKQRARGKKDAPNAGLVQGRSIDIGFKGDDIVLVLECSDNISLAPSRFWCAGNVSISASRGGKKNEQQRDSESAEKHSRAAVLVEIHWPK